MRSSLFFLIMLCVVHYLMYSLGYGNFVIGIVSIIVYAFLNIQYLKNKSKTTIFTYEFLFSISFFLSCLVFPVLSFENSEIYTISLIGGGLKESSKWRFFNLALLGYYMYMIGLYFGLRSNSSKSELPKFSVNNNLLLTCNILTSLSLFYFYFRGGNRLIDRYTGDAGSIVGFGVALFYVTVFYTISSMNVILRISNQVRARRSFFSHFHSLHYVFNSALILPLLLLSGYRSQFIQYVIPIFFMFIMYVKKISNKKLLLYLMAGALLMVGIGIVRVGESVIGQGHDLTYYLRDFLIEDIAGIWLVDYTDTHGITGGSNAILQMVSFIPFMGGIVSMIIGSQNIAESSSILFTYAYRSDGTGLGTNIVGDLYYTFGLLGVIICLFLLGVFVKKISQTKSIYGLLCYLLILGNAIFSTRVEFFYIVRLLGFSLIILWLMIMVSGGKTKVIK